MDLGPQQQSGHGAILPAQQGPYCTERIREVLAL